MSSKVDIQRNKLIHLENILVMYGVYNAETLEKLINLYIHYTADNPCMRNYLQDQIVKAYKYYSQMHGDPGIQHYAINSMLYLRMIKDKYIELYNECISQLHILCKSN